MTSTKFSQEVAEAVNKLVEVLVSGFEKPTAIQDTPTEKLITDMEVILQELKSRLLPKTIALSELPVGAKIQDPNTKYYDAPIVWLVADHGYYGETLTTLVSERILTFKAFDASEPNNSSDWRADFGNNDYKVSNIAQWLNSNEGNWFKPLHVYDQAPTEEFVSSRPYADESGFLTNFSEEFIQHINDTVLGKVFLLSDEEVGLAKGKRLKLFENEDYRKTKPTKECVQIDNEGDENEPDWWWLRTPYFGNSHSARSVNNSGVLICNNAWYSHRGVRPALNLLSKIRVKAEPNENGVYEIVWGIK